MGRKASPETLLRTEKRINRELNDSLQKWERRSNEWKANAEASTKRIAELCIEVTEWKRRFDALLLRTPKQPGSEGTDHGN